MCWTGYGLALVPLAAALGTATHMAGDSLTRCGVPAALAGDDAGVPPLPAPLRFTTGKTAERWIVGPILMLSLGGILFLDLR